MKLFLHIGSPKAGSSAIQIALGRSRERLAAMGVACHNRPRDLSTLYENIQRLAMPLQAKFDSIDAARAWSEDNWQAFEAEIAAQAPPLTLLSSEHFLNLPDPGLFVDRLGRLFDDIHVLAYIRDPVAQFASNLDQRIRGGARLSELFSAWEMARPMWQADALDRYLAVLGPERLQVRNFDRANLIGGDVVADFFHHASAWSGVDLAPPAAPVRANESFSAAATAWILIANELMLERHKGLNSKHLVDKRRALIARIRDNKALCALPRLVLEDEVIIRFLRAHNAAGCAHVNATYLIGQPPLAAGIATGDDAGELPDVETLRARTRDWILSHLTPETLALLSRELMDLA